MLYRTPAMLAFLIPIALLGASTAPQAIAGDGGLGISPGIILIQDAPVGVHLDLGAQGLHIMVTNGSAADQVFALNTVAPDADQIQAYEAGYEPLPDATWVKLDHAEVPVPAHGMASTGLVFDIPDRPDLHNRHFMLYVEAGPRLAGGFGAVLRVRCRVLIETAISTQPAERGGDLSLSPGRIAMASQADGSWSGRVEVRNGGSRLATFDLLTIAQAYGVGEESRRARFFGSGQTGVTQDGWAVPEVTSFTLEPGASRVVRFTGKPPRMPKPAEQVDEVFFLARRADAEDPPRRRRRLNNTDYNRSELLRLRYANDQPSNPAPEPKP